MRHYGWAVATTVAGIAALVAVAAAWARRPPGDAPPFDPGSSDPGSFDHGSFDHGSSVRAGLRLDPASVRPGETVNITYVVKNGGPQPRTYRFSSGKEFDITVDARPSGRVVWRLSQGRMFTQSLKQWTLGPGERRLFTAQWQPDRDLPEGTYEITAFLTPMGESGGAMSIRSPIRVGSRSGTSGERSSLTIHLRDLFQGERSYQDKRVTLSGVYRGWKGGEGSPPVKRADWVLEGDGRAVYVTGPLPSARVGDTVTVTGTVRHTKDGRPYLECKLGDGGLHPP